MTVTQTVTVTPEAAAPPPATPAPESPAPAAPAPSTEAAPASGVPQTSVAPTAAAAAPTTPPVQPATSGTIAEYFKDKGVAMEPQKAAGFTALNVVLPVPPGWRVVPDPNVPDAFGVIADRTGGDGLYTSNAQVQVYKLVGEFDAKEAISHGYIDSQKLRAWQSTSASMADYGGFPSSVITGTYRDNDMTLNTTRRYIIATGGADHYLVSLAVTTAANQVVAAATATDAILNGFRVTDPTAAPTTTPAPAPPAPAAASPLGAPSPRRPPHRSHRWQPRLRPRSRPRRPQFRPYPLQHRHPHPLQHRHRPPRRHPRPRPRLRWCPRNSPRPDSYPQPMVVGAVVCLGLAVLIGGSGLWTLARRAGVDLTSQVVRAVAPTQIAAAVMLAAGAIVALAAPGAIGTIGLVGGVIGAVGTIAAGSWQGARYAARREAASGGGCGSSDGCGGCAKVCGTSGT